MKKKYLVIFILLVIALVVFGAIVRLRSKPATPAVTQATTANNTTSTQATKILYPSGGEHLVAGKSYDLKWTGGSDDMEIFLIEVSLKSVGASVSSVDRVYHVANTGSYQYTVPSYVTPGAYQFEIGDAFSNEFQVDSR